MALRSFLFKLGGLPVVTWTRIASASSIVGTPASLGDTTGANLIVVSGAMGSSGNSENVSDNKSNAYTIGPSKTQGIIKHIAYYCLSPTVGASHTVTFNANSAFQSWSVEAWKCSVVPSLDVVSTPQGSASGSTTVSTGSATPTKNETLAFATVGGQGTPLSIGSGFTVGASRVGVGGTNYASAIAYKQIASGGAAENPAWSWSSGGGDNAASLLIFKG